MKRDHLHEIARRGAVAERSGDWQEADRAYARVFSEAVHGGDILPAADALRGQARARRHLGTLEEAEELAILSWEIARLHSLAQATARAVNTVATIRHLHRDLAEAQSLYARALELALDTGDDELVGLTCQNLGVVAATVGDLRQARTYYLESIASSIRSGNKENEVMAYVNLGKVCCDLGEWLEAEVYLERGIEIAGRLPNVFLLGRLHVNLADVLLHTDEISRATEVLRRAESFAERADDRGTLVTAERHRGIAAALAGNSGAAIRHLERATALAVGADLDQERAEALRDLALHRWEEGASGSARSAMEDALRSFRAAGAERGARQATETLEQWRGGSAPE